LDTALETTGLSPELTPGNVIVTGSASGLGEATANAVGCGGDTAIAFDINEPLGASNRRHLIVDCGDRAAIEKAVAQWRERAVASMRSSRTSALMICGDFDAVSADQWERLIQVHVLGTAALVGDALPHLLRADNPGIVAVASTLGLRVLGAATAYCGSKFAVVGFTRALALDLAGRVGDTLLCTGGMKTAFFGARQEQYKPAADAFEKIHLNDPQRVADTVIFALTRPRGMEVRELIVAPSRETSCP
jgi:NADP-dependent 3-hydroxy acid dehydrogenase YdfG